MNNKLNKQQSLQTQILKTRLYFVHPQHSNILSIQIFHKAAYNVSPDFQKIHSTGAMINI